MVRLVLVGVALFVSGCGVSRPSLPAPVATAGTIKFSDGSPLTQVQLYFVPTDALAPAFGKVADGGAFTLTTYEGKTGICPGKYVVYVRPLPDVRPADAGKGRTTLAKVPEKFKDDGGRSPLAVVVNAGTTSLDLTVALK